MSELIVEGVKISKNPISTKVLYSKDGKYYIRSGVDNFQKGDRIRQHVSSYFSKWGFRKLVEGTVSFRDGRDLADNIDKFEATKGYTVKYNG